MREAGGVVSHTDLAAPWTEGALCASPAYADCRDIWFAPKTDKEAVRKARQICWSCPLLQTCGQRAIEDREPWGMWGAVSEGERRAMLRRRGICLTVAEDEVAPERKPVRQKREPAKCGTRAGYQKHLREKTEICGPCRQANTDADNRLRRTGTSKVAA